MVINQLFLIGRLCRTPVLEKKNGKDSCYITIACKRSFKNSDGEYDTDFISCTVWNVIAKRVCEYCRKGDMISVKGRIQNNNYKDKDDNQVYSYEIIAEQVSFIQNKNKEEKEKKIQEIDDGMQPRMGNIK